MNTDKLKSELAEQLPISEVCEKLLGIELHSSGSQLRGLCPLHAERTPSFYVSDLKSTYHCFGCKAGGDAIDLLRRVENYGYKEALVALASQTEVEISDYERPMTPVEVEEEGIRSRAEAWLGALPHPATDRVSSGAAERFGVGPATSGSGLDRDFPSYCLRGVIFPYRDPSGRLVGWKARQPDKKMFGIPKESPIWEPTLFGIQEAREWIRAADGELFVVEGEYDATTAWDKGHANVVALGGSAFVDEHMEMVKRLKVRKLTFVLDGDEGGRSAARIIAEHWWADKDVHVGFKALPDGTDPDEILNIGFDFTMYSTESAIEWLLRVEWDKRREEGLTGKIDFLEYVRKEYGPKLDASVEDLVLLRVAELIGLPEADALDLTRAERTDLQSPESEEAVLGECLRKDSYFIAIRKEIVKADFFVTRHRRVWQMLEDAVAEGLVFEPKLMKSMADKYGVDPEYIQKLYGAEAENLTWHERRVVDLAVRRDAITKVEKFSSLISDLQLNSTTAIGDLTTRLTTKAMGRGSDFPTIAEQVDEAMAVMHERMKNPTAVHGIDMGEQFPRFSTNLQGLQPGRLLLLAAASGEGKSTISLQIACALAVHQAVPIDFVSLEMDETEMLYKLASHMTGVKATNISGGKLEEVEAKLVEQALVRIRNSPLRLYCPDGITPNEFVLYCRQSKMDRRTEVFFIDYAQLISPDPGMERNSDYKLYGDFGRDAKQKVARAMDVTVWACAQLNRAAKEMDRPTKENMGDSYDLVRHADVIAILKGEEESETCDFWVDKNRQGPGGILIPMVFEKDIQTFREAQGFRVPPYRVEP